MKRQNSHRIAHITVRRKIQRPAPLLLVTAIIGVAAVTQSQGHSFDALTTNDIRPITSGTARGRISAKDRSLTSSSDCLAGKPYCYDAPIHLSSVINNPR